MQSHQSVLKGIGIINQKFISKTDFFYKLMQDYILLQSVKKVKQKCLAFSLICGIINMVMKGAENRKARKTSDRICMYGRADTGRPSAQKNR